MFNRKLKEQIEYLYAKLRKIDRLERYITTTNERIDELEKEYSGQRLCKCESNEEKKI